MTTDEQAAAARACEEYYIQNHFLIALSGMTQSQEYYSTRVGGMENGELLSAITLQDDVCPHLEYRANG